MATPSIHVLTPPNKSRGLILGLKILSYLRTERRSMSLSELAAVVNLGKPSALRLLRTLETLGYVSRDESKNYQLEAGTFVAGTQENLSVLRRLASLFCGDLRSKCGETTTLACLFGDYIRVVDVFESPQNIRMSNYVGRILQPFASSLGKAIAAFQDEALAQTLLDVYGICRLTRHTLVDQLAIQNEFATVREQGYAEDKEETVDGGYCVGAPIYNPENSVIAAISISAPKFRVPPKVMEELPIMVREAASGITAELKTQRHP
jgi:DNA-binding IclR family transcriptional regulator